MSSPVLASDSGRAPPVVASTASCAPCHSSSVFRTTTNPVVQEGWNCPPGTRCGWFLVVGIEVDGCFGRSAVCLALLHLAAAATWIVRWLRLPAMRTFIAHGRRRSVRKKHSSWRVTCPERGWHGSCSECGFCGRSTCRSARRRGMVQGGASVGRKHEGACLLDPPP